MKIRLLLAGGTIDKRYNELNGELGFSKSHVQTMLKQSRTDVNISVQEVLMIDSLDMTDEHRQQLLKACQDTPEKLIIITHGTDTMPQTACLLGKNIHDKTIVLIGAMIPYAFSKSDAMFNLGGGVIAVQALSSGVYIAMNGRIFSWDNVRKNKELGKFETL